MVSPSPDPFMDLGVSSPEEDCLDHDALEETSVLSRYLDLYAHRDLVYAVLSLRNEIRRNRS